MDRTNPRIIDDLETTTVGDSTIVTADGRVHLALTADEASLLPRLDGTVGLEEIDDRFGADALDLVNDLREAGMLVGATPSAQPRIAMTPAGIEFAGFDRVVAWCNRVIGRMIGRPVVAMSGGVAVAGLVGALVPPPLDGPRFSAPVTLAALLVVMLVAGFVHETAHALVIHRSGRRVGRAGFGFYWGELSFFVDATDAYFLPKGRRIVQTLVGPATDAVLAGALGLAAHVIGSGPWAVLAHQAAVTGWLVALINAAPILKLDGHWALADLLDTADLHAEMRDALRRLRGRSRDRRSVVLGLYAAASAASGVALLASSAAAWFTHYGPLVGTAWTSGVAGAALAVAFVAPTAGAAATAGLQFVRTLASNSRGGIARREVTQP